MKPNSYSLATNLDNIKHKIKEACRAINKPPEEITLVAVSKGQDFALIKQAYELGIRDFGESYAQELKTKITQANFENIYDINWHYIGAIQRNKIKIISRANFVHSIDSVRHAQILSQAATHEIGIFLQVNLNEDCGRVGFKPEEILGALDACARLSHIKILGLMTILPLKTSRPSSYWFMLMNNLREKLSRPDLKLSMGMSQDYTEAIKYHADIIRIGTDLFGPRS